MEGYRVRRGLGAGVGGDVGVVRLNMRAGGTWVFGSLTPHAIGVV